MRQSNALYRLNAYLKREEASLTKYWERDVKNEHAAKVWDEKNLELASILDEFIEELEYETARGLQNLEVLRLIDITIEQNKLKNPENSKMVIHLLLSEREGHTCLLNLHNYGPI